MIDKQLTVFCIKLMYTTHYAKYWGIILINTNNISTIYVFSLLHYSKCIANESIKTFITRQN